MGKLTPEITARITAAGNDPLVRDLTKLHMERVGEASDLVLQLVDTPEAKLSLLLNTWIDIAEKLALTVQVIEGDIKRDEFDTMERFDPRLNPVLLLTKAHSMLMAARLKAAMSEVNAGRDPFRGLDGKIAEAFKVQAKEAGSIIKNPIPTI